MSEEGRVVETGFEQASSSIRSLNQRFADPNGDIVIIDPTMRRMKIYSPQLERVRDIRFEVSAAAARALWGPHRWKK